MSYPYGNTVPDVRPLLAHDAQECSGAGDRDRTGMASLEGWGSTIELHPRVVQGNSSARSEAGALSSTSGAAVDFRPSRRGA